MPLIHPPMAVAAAIACASVFALPASAAEHAQGSHGPSRQSFTDQQLRQFVKAQSNVQSTLHHWNSKLAKAHDKEAERQKENQAMIKAVKRSGLTPRQYNQIAHQAHKDPKLTKRIQSFMKPR